MVWDKLTLNSTVLLDCAHITIGDRVLFATGVSLITATHETSLQSRRDNVEYAEPITIGDDCWLGANVTILPGVTIGKGCTIGAGSVVSRSIPDYSVAVGVPARVIKKVDPIDWVQRESHHHTEKMLLQYQSSIPESSRFYVIIAFGFLNRISRSPQQSLLCSGPFLRSSWRSDQLVSRQELCAITVETISQ